MSFESPTYEEYKKATVFARVRYKYGLIVLILCWVTLLILIYFIFIYSTELSTSPMLYVAKSVDGDCYCNTFDGKTYYFNSTSISWREREFYLP